MLKYRLVLSAIRIVVLILWAVPVFAQVDTAWVRRYNGPGNSYDEAYAIAVDGSGNVYVTGWSVGSETGSDYATIKYCPNGDTAWVRRHDGPGNGQDWAWDVAVDNSDNIYVTGKSYASGTFWDYATIKYYPNGDTAWVRRYNGPGNYGDEARAVAVDDAGNVYVTGLSEDSGWTSDYATIKYYPNGDTAWVRRYNGPDDFEGWPYGISIDGSNNIYVTGYYRLLWNDYEFATIKYYPNGDTAWVRRYNGPGEVFGYFDQKCAVASDSSGNVYVTGSTAQNTSHPYNHDYTTIKYYPNGDTAWVRRYNGPGNAEDWALAIAVDDSGNIYVTGKSSGSGTFWDYATIKYYPNGDTAWVRRYKGLGNGSDLATAIAVDGSGNVYVTGYSYGSGMSSDYATIKYYPNGDTAWVRRYNGPGNSADYATAITIDSSGDVYVTGVSFGSETGSDYATIKYVDLSAPPEIWSVCSNRGPNMNGVCVTIEGCKFDTLASVKLVKSGIPEDSIIGSDVTVLSYNTKIICRFDLAGQPIGSVWDLVVTNPNWKADTLFSAFTIVSPSELSTKDVLCVLSSNHERIEDFQANAKAWSKFNGEPLDSIIHSVSLYKAPDKLKNVDYDNDDTTQVFSIVIDRGWWQYQVDPETGDAYGTNLLQVNQMTPSEFAGLNFYDPDNFLFHHYVSIKEIQEYPDSLIFVLEAIPKRPEWTYSKLELTIDYTKGLVVNSIVHSDTIYQQSVTVTEEQLYNGIWVATKSIKTTTDTSETLQTELVLSDIQVNMGIPDSVFQVDEGKLTIRETAPERLEHVLEPASLPKELSDEWDDLKAYKPNPILFLHGFASGNPGSWETVMGVFRGAMYSYYADDITWYVDCPNFQVYPGANASIDGTHGWGYVTCSEIIGRLTNFNSVAEEYRPPKVNIVAHSAGGLGARECVTGGTEFPNMHTKVQKLITTGTPHLGSELTYVGRGLSLLERYLIVRHLRRADLGSLAPVILIEAAKLIFKIDPTGEIETDMTPGSAFYQDLYSRPQHDSTIEYFAIADTFTPDMPERIIPGSDDWVVSKKSQLGKGETPSFDFYQYLKGHGKARAAHFMGEQDASLGHILRFIDPRPDVVITSPQTDEDLAEACTLRVELQNEYLPATTRLFVTMTRLGDPPLADYWDFFRPDTSWRAEGPSSIKSGRYDDTISLSKAPPGKYTVNVRVRNPAGLENEASVEFILGVDLMTDIGGGPARRGFNKNYGLAYSNLGNAEASNVTLEARLPSQVEYVSSSPPGNLVGNTVEWDVGSLVPGEGGNVSVTVYIPTSVPQGTFIVAISDISTTDDDVDWTNDQSVVTDEVVGSVDPNDKAVQPQGFGEDGYIGEGERLRYTVFFENVDTATADAIYVTVVDTLDPDLDWSSLRIGPMSHPDKCTASFDSLAGVITWFCDSIMLPPDTLPPAGEGWGTFSILPHYLEHGTKIKNRAAIQFDFNPWMYAPMDSSYIINTIDEYPPSSRVTALWDTVSAMAFEVNWRGRDDSLGFGSGVESYFIYVSDNGDPYYVWIPDTSDTFATFSGELGHSYCFYSIARDSVGNVEDAPMEPDACTRSPTYVRGDANGDGVINVADIVYLVNFLYRGGDPPIPMEAGDANCDDIVNVADVVYLVNYLYRGGDPPGCP